MGALDGPATFFGRPLAAGFEVSSSSETVKKKTSYSPSVPALYFLTGIFDIRVYIIRHAVTVGDSFNHSRDCDA